MNSQALETINNYLTLCKPKVVILMLITVWIGMLLAAESLLPLNLVIYSTVGIGLAACSAAVINHMVDKHIDQKMARTMRRPIATGKISQKHAGIFAMLLAFIAIIILSFKVNILTTYLTVTTLIGYAFFYTMYLKRATPQNIVIGGLSGAMPPLLGWVSVTSQLHPHAWLLVLIIFVWTPPHFWALAIYRQNDYKQAKIPMLPVTHGIAFTKISTLLYTILLFPITALPFVVKMSGLIYFISATILNFGFLYYVLKLVRACDIINEKRRAIMTFNYSIVYLLLIFASLLLDRLLI